MAMGKAIIATDIGEVREALKDGAGVLVKTNDPVEFGEAIALAIQSKDLMKNLGIKAREKAENIYNYDKMSEQVEKALLKALQ
jgi:glycosyltransferase involved in cell wall biosynthesis